MSTIQASVVVLLSIVATFIFAFLVFKLLKRFAGVSKEEDGDDLNVVNSMKFMAFCRDVRVRQTAISREIEIKVFREQGMVLNQIEEARRDGDHEDGTGGAHRIFFLRQEKEQGTPSTCLSSSIVNSISDAARATSGSSIQGEQQGRTNCRVSCSFPSPTHASPQESAVADEVDSSTTTSPLESVQEEQQDGYNVCAICLEPLSVGDTIAWSKRNMKCTHSFHANCLTTWLRKKDDCPCCREMLLSGNTFLKMYQDDDFKMFSVREEEPASMDIV